MKEDGQERGHMTMPSVSSLKAPYHLLDIYLLQWNELCPHARTLTDLVISLGLAYSANWHPADVDNGSNFEGDDVSKYPTGSQAKTFEPSTHRYHLKFLAFQTRRFDIFAHEVDVEFLD